VYSGCQSSFAKVPVINITPSGASKLKLTNGTKLALL
jgi:hypothetical protein